jgi:hypothetical protein
VETIAHGYHFQAGDPDVAGGRPGQPWVWSDPRTGTHLPLSYRRWPGTWHPDDLGISRWQMAAQFGGFLPGGGPGSPANLTQGSGEAGGEANFPPAKDRSQITGPLLIDCMLCHHTHGSGYSPFEWTAQIKQENFAYAPVAAMGLAVVTGSLRRLKDDFDPAADGAADQLPQVRYEASRFRSDGRVLFNLVRKPENNACYYCHTHTTADAVKGQRWLHDEDVHLRAGMACVDCHRNGLDHATVRGYTGEVHSAGPAAAALSCRGCHLGSAEAEGPTPLASSLTMAGKLGAPRPLHRGIPPLHFEKMECTACHSGPLPGEPQRQLLSAVHHLGDPIKWTGTESPAIEAAVQLRLTAGDDGTGGYAPHRSLWPAYWGVRRADGQITPLPPDQAAGWLRRPLKVRQDFNQEVGEVKLSLAQRRELLGEERAKLDESQWTVAEKEQLRTREEALRQEQIRDRLTQGLAAIQAELPSGQAVFVSGGQIHMWFDDQVVTTATESLSDPAAPYLWPIAHNVRPATQALGAKSCTECHSDDAKFFPQTLVGIGVVPGQDVAQIPLPEPLDGDAPRMAAWNQLMQGRAAFKWFSVFAVGAAGLLLLGSVLNWSWEQATAAGEPRPWTARVGYAAFFASIAVMGLTSFGSLAQGHEMHGWALLAHVSLAGAFVVFLAVVAYYYLPRSSPGPGRCSVVHDGPFVRGTAILMVAACFTTAAVIIPGMFPWLGTEQMLSAIAVHRFAGLAALLFTATHALALIVSGRPRGT